MPKPSPKSYWQRNLRLIAVLLSVWALVSFGFSILLALPLQDFQIGQVPASFWWAHQGAMFVFVALIFIYAKRMDALDKEFGLDEDAE